MDDDEYLQKMELFFVKNKIFLYQTIAIVLLQLSQFDN